MAQWRGQFSGHTHSSKIEDVEAILRHAVTVYREQDTEGGRERKGKAVRNLAARLLRARLKLLKAKVAVSEPRVAPSPVHEARQRALAEARAAGTAAILIEFGAPELAGPDSV